MKTFGVIVVVVLAVAAVCAAVIQSAIDAVP